MDEFDEDDEVISSRKSKKNSTKSQVPTWADAARMVLERYEHAVPHKQILQIIQDENLKPCGRGTMPLACLNAMLNSNCKGKDALFYRAPGQAACFGLKSQQPKNLADCDDESTASSESQPDFTIAHSTRAASMAASGSSSKSKESPRTAALKSARLKAANLQRSRNQAATMPGSPGAALVAMPPRKPGAALCVMPPKKRQKLDADDSGDGAKESTGDISIASSPNTRSSTWAAGGSGSEKGLLSEEQKRDAKYQQQFHQRLQRHRQHQQQLAERSRQQQQQLRMVHESKRGGNSSGSASSGSGGGGSGGGGIPFGSKPPIPRQPEELDEIVRQIKLEQQEELQRDSLRQQRKNNKSAIEKKPPPVTGFLDVKGSEAATSNIDNALEYVAYCEGLKKLKKMSTVEQIKRTKEGKVDLLSPESLFATISLKGFLNNAMFKALPASYQYQLMMLLPDVDRITDKDGIVRMIPNALTNEFFTKACLEWQEKLLEGEFNTDIVQRVKQEEGKIFTLDPWKEKYFEPAYGISSVSNPIADDGEARTEMPDMLSKERDSSWITFLKFSENTADEHKEEFKKIQKILRQKAEKEAIRRSLQRKQQLLKSPAENVAKDRSKRAVKRAQLFQKKLFYEKQLMEINNRLADKSNPLPDNLQERLMAKKREVTLILRKIFDSIKHGKHHPTTTSESSTPKHGGSDAGPASGNVVGKTRSDEELRRRERRKAKKKKRNREHRNENELITEEYAKFFGVDGLALGGSHSKKHKKDKHKKKKHRDAESKDGGHHHHYHHHSSKIIKGPSVYVKKTSIPCPCKLAPMVICNGCGAFCHSDCISSDKLCTLCVPT
eukprot:gene4685-5300_t